MTHRLYGRQYRRDIGELPPTCKHVCLGERGPSLWSKKGRARRVWNVGGVRFPPIANRACEAVVVREVTGSIPGQNGLLCVWGFSRSCPLAPCPRSPAHTCLRVGGPGAGITCRGIGHRSPVSASALSAPRRFDRLDSTPQVRYSLSI